MTDLDLTKGLTPQFEKPEEGTADILGQILLELKKINSQLIFLTDQVIKEEDIIRGNKEDIDIWPLLKMEQEKDF